MLEIEVLPALSDNYVFILFEPQKGVSAVVDPAEAEPVARRLEALGRGLDWILITHHHGDHTGGNRALKERYGCKIAGPGKDAQRIPGIDVGLEEGQEFTLGAEKAEIFETPGHARGHISFWFEQSRALFCGDVLFVMGCGRLGEGDAGDMLRSLEKYERLPDEAVVYCGHEYTQKNASFARTVDPDNPELKKRVEEVDALRAQGEATVPTTLGAERATNPFLRYRDPGVRAALGMENASDLDVFAEIRRRKDRF